jgi:Tol biopolymer transport system component
MLRKLICALAALVVIAGCGSVSSTNGVAGSDIAFVRDEGSGTIGLWRMESGSIHQTGSFSWSVSPARVVFSPDGSKAAMMLERGGQYDIGIVSAHGGVVEWLTDDPSNDGDPSFSRDGRRIVFYSRRDGHSQIYVMDSDGISKTRLTDTPDLSDDDTSPSFSWDGRQITFASDRDSETGHTHIYVMNADGSNVRQLTSGEQIHDTEPAFSPDGRQIVYSSANDADGSHDIYAVSADGARKIALTWEWGDCHSPSFSPDGWTIMFASDRQSVYPQVWMMKTDGYGKGRITESGGAFPSWTNGG